MKTEYNKTTVMPYRNIKRFSQVNKHCKSTMVYEVVWQLLLE